MVGHERARHLLERILWMTDEYVQLAASPKSYGTGEIFHRLEIHLIYSIGTKPGINVTALARLHGITKSAVSQAVRKLIRRELVRSYKAPENRKEVLLRLSDQGIAAFTAHNAFHIDLETPYVEELAGYTEAEARGVGKAVEMLLRRAQAVRRQEEAWTKRRKEEKE